MIYLASDHRGFNLKERIKQWLSDWGYEFKDLGAHGYDQSDDYPDFVAPVAEEISKDSDDSIGIILGASGQGEAIVANRFKNVRAVVYYGGPDEILELSRKHNDANILSLGATFLDEKQAKHAIRLWLNTLFSNEERHIRRIQKIEKISCC